MRCNQRNLLEILLILGYTNFCVGFYLPGIAPVNYCRQSESEVCKVCISRMAFALFPSVSPSVNWWCVRIQTIRASYLRQWNSMFVSIKCWCTQHLYISNLLTFWRLPIDLLASHHPYTNSPILIIVFRIQSMQCGTRMTNAYASTH